MKDLFLAYLGRTLNQAPESVAEKLFKKSDDDTLTDDLNENALDLLLGLDAERVKGLKPDTKQFFDNGYKKAEGEISARWEKSLREKFGIDPEGKLQGDALADAIKAAMAGEGAKPDKIKASPEYLDLESRMRQQIEEMKAQHEKALSDYRQEVERDKTWSDVGGRIKSLIRADQRINQDAVTDVMIDLFASKYRVYDYKADGDDYLPLKDGEPVLNAQQYTRRLSELVLEDAAQVFPQVKQPPSGNAGNQKGPQGRQSTARFKDEEDYMTQYQQQSDPAERVAMYNAWKAQQGS